MLDVVMPVVLVGRVENLGQVATEPEERLQSVLDVLEVQDPALRT